MSGPVLIGFESLDDIRNQFETGLIDDGGPMAVIFAAYECGSYDGEAFVLLKDSDGLYEVNASHCSCYGLEGQFDLEETTAAVLCQRIEAGWYGFSDEFKEKLSEVLRGLGGDKP